MQSSTVETRELKITASDTLDIYRLPSQSEYPRIVPASPDREWMDAATRGWANRCLPLRIANESGWWILNECDFEVEWDGQAGMDCLHFTFPHGETGMVPFNMVGYGIVSWAPPYLLKTPAGMNLWVRGPANYPKDGIVPTEGIVETDWCPYPFTINWKMTRPGVRVRFAKGEPICFLIPIRRFEAEQFTPTLQNLVSNPELENDYQIWHARRLQAKAISGTDGAQGKQAVAGQGQYIRGESATGVRMAEHQTKLKIKGVVELEPASEIPQSRSANQSAANDAGTITVNGYNGVVTWNDQTITIERPRGLRGLFFSRGLPNVAISLSSVKAIQFQEQESTTQMQFLRFVVGNAAPILDYASACRDPYTVLIDKNQLRSFQDFIARFKENSRVN